MVKHKFNLLSSKSLILLQHIFYENEDFRGYNLQLKNATQFHMAVEILVGFLILDLKLTRNCEQCTWPSQLYCRI